MDVYKRHWYEFGAEGFSWMFASWHLFTFKSKFIEYVSSIWRRQSWLFTVNNSNSFSLYMFPLIFCVGVSILNSILCFFSPVEICCVTQNLIYTIFLYMPCSYHNKCNTVKLINFLFCLIFRDGVDFFVALWCYKQRIIAEIQNNTCTTWRHISP